MAPLVDIRSSSACIYVIELHLIAHFIWPLNKHGFTGIIDAEEQLQRCFTCEQYVYL